MKRLFLIVFASFSLAACNDDALVPDPDILAFTEALQGQWASSEISIVPVAKKQSVSIFPSNNYACDQISSSFQKKDVVSQFTIAVKGSYICVAKTYTCSLGPEQISWLIEPGKSSVDNDNSMVGKDFVIKEINEGAVQAKYNVLYFNLDRAAKSKHSHANQLWLEVTYDSKESSDAFIIKLKKVKD